MCCSSRVIMLTLHASVDVKIYKKASRRLLVTLIPIRKEKKLVKQLYFNIVYYHLATAFICFTIKYFLCYEQIRQAVGWQTHSIESVHIWIYTINCPARTLCVRAIPFKNLSREWEGAKMMSPRHIFCGFGLLRIKQVFLKKHFSRRLF